MTDRTGIASWRSYGGSPAVSDGRSYAKYIDHECGGRADRAEFRQMFTDVGQRKFDLVLVWALDRRNREGVAETFQYIKRLTLHGVQFVSFTEEHFRRLDRRES